MADSGLRGRLFAAVTGRGGDVSGSTSGDLRAQLLVIGGASTRTRSGINLTAAAQQLGVSRRTAERWVQSATTGRGQRPSPASARAIARRSRQAASTKAGRRASLAGSQTQRLARTRGITLAVTGTQGPGGHGKDYSRFRRTVQKLSPEDAQAALDAWVDGGEQGFMAWTTDRWSGSEDEDGVYTGYLEGWEFQAPPEDIEFLDPGAES